ncbi:MAG: MotE family protein [Devosia nanyangense]|uniref:MotE family protein n=1 Tax=Devosia nanyangense TaxID=1228055 RepID=A0A933L056_9HYPH|nr:MotE family protein [Devosia nanyangense]
MKSIRLLPVVIFAALALLIFKGIGLVTSGGYVLTGPVVAIAQEGGHAEDLSGTTPPEAVLTDTSPTLGDTAPTIATKLEAAASESASGHETSEPSSTDGGHGEASSEAAQAAAEVACPESPAPASEPAHGEGLNDNIGNALATGCPPPAAPVNEFGDALPTTKDGSGKIVPLAVAEGGDSATALLQRLSDRRAELDRREAELAMRTDLVAAAEKRLDERTKALEELEAKVSALVDEKQAVEDAGFKGVVSMYETMKPKEAAKVFDQLDLQVLLRVVRAMNPRKMAPVLAAMSAQKADELTTALAAVKVSATVADAGENLAALPQIVGK